MKALAYKRACSRVQSTLHDDLGEQAAFQTASSVLLMLVSSEDMWKMLQLGLKSKSLIISLGPLVPKVQAFFAIEISIK